MTHSSTEQPSAFHFQLNNVLYCLQYSPGSGKLAQKTLLILFQRPPAWGWLFQPFQHDSRGTDNQLQAETSDTKTGTTSCGQLFLRTMTLCCFFIQSIQERFLLSYMKLIQYSLGMSHPIPVTFQFSENCSQHFRENYLELTGI